MRLVVRTLGGTISEFQFAAGPVHIGRHADSQIFLPERTVSRHHAVIFSTQDQKWFIEDLDSPNKTYLNGKPIHKVELASGDSIRISKFTIEINLEDAGQSQVPINLQDTLAQTMPGMEALSDTSTPSQQIITRRINAKHAPDIKLPMTRARDFMQAAESICRADSLDEVLNALIRIASSQFTAFHCWCALRNQPAGPMTCHSGRKRDGTSVGLSEIKLNEKITEAVDKRHFLLFPRLLPQLRQDEKIQSAMIAPIVGLEGCLGVIYLDNDLAHTHYSLSDLDYLMLLAIHTSVIVENF